MSEVPQIPRAPTKWLESLERSRAQIAAGQTLLLLPVLDQLRAAAERLEADMGLTPDEVQPNPGR